MSTPRVRRSTAAMIASVAVLSLVGASCSKSSTPDVSTTPTTVASATTSGASTTGCADVAALKSSLAALAAIQPTQDGVASLTAALADVKTKLDAAEASASATLQPLVTQVKTSFDALESAASGVSASNFNQQMPAIATALFQVGTATTALTTQLAAECPGS